MNIRVILATVICVFISNPIYSQRIQGKIVDDQGKPLSYANVCLLQRGDSAFINGATSKEDGTFMMEASCEDGIIKVSFMGYKTVYKNLMGKDAGVISLSSDARMLSDVTVKASHKYVKPNSRGIVVNMEGNPLSQLSSAEDAIKQMPMINAADGDITVLGKGTPEIYINNRKVRNKTELGQLSPDNIQKVEIITVPSSKYESSVGSVIIIRTKRKDAGLAGRVKTSGTVAEVLSGNGNVDLSYLSQNGLGLYATANYSTDGYKQERSYSENFNENLCNAVTSGNYKGRTQTFKLTTGSSYDFTTTNSIGIRYEYSRTPTSTFNSNSNNIYHLVNEDGQLSTINHSFNQSDLHYVNAYAAFKFGKKKNLELTADADYLYGANRGNGTAEEMMERTVSDISTRNGSAYHLAAAKANLNMEFGRWSVDAGVEYSNTKNRLSFASNASIGNDAFQSSQNKETQNLTSSYASFMYKPSALWSFSGGIRLEATGFSYMKDDVKVDAQSKSYMDILPDLSINYNQKNFSVGLSYKSRVGRPSYSMLNNNYSYATHTSWETGNPLLKSAVAHGVNLSFSWKETILNLSYSRLTRMISTIYTYLPTEQVNVRQEINLPNYNNYQAILSHTMQVGLWHPTFQGMLTLQDLKYGEPRTSYTKPSGLISINNRFDLPWGIFAYLNGTWTSKGHSTTVYQYADVFSMYVMLSKRVKNWSFNIFANDILDTYSQKSVIETNGVSYKTFRNGASQLVQLSVTYSFNKKKTFKGQGAAGAELNRL